MISYFCRQLQTSPTTTATASTESPTTSITTTMEDTFATGRYSKRKRTQVNYCMSELDVSDDEDASEFVQVKKRKAMKSRPLPKAKVFPFLELPAEIRNIIYNVCLVDDSGINVVGTYKNKRRSTERVSAEAMAQLSGTNNGYNNQLLNDQRRAQLPEPVQLVPALLAVNKQIYAEARDILYANEFVFSDTQALYSFLVNIGPAATKYLQELRLLQWGYGRALKAYNHSCFALLASATNIKTFHFDTNAGWRSSDPKWTAEQLYRDAFPWLEAIGVAKGKVDAAIDVVQMNEEGFQKRRFNQPAQTWKLVPQDECMKTFRDTLSSMLIKQHNRIMTTPTKKRKVKAKV